MDINHSTGQDLGSKKIQTNESEINLNELWDKLKGEKELIIIKCESDYKVEYDCAVNFQDKLSE